MTRHEANDTAPAWSADGRFVYFLSKPGDANQVWRIPMAGGEASPVTELPLDVGTFRLSADGRRMVVSLSVYPDCTELACTVARDEAASEAKTTGVAYDRLFMRHWDHWLDQKRSRLFALALDEAGQAAGEAAAQVDHPEAAGAEDPLDDRAELQQHVGVEEEVQQARVQ